ncbi:MAG: hypothetical protein RR047_00540 [Bacilli bacterium]
MREKRKQVFLGILLIISFIMVVLGTSYAIFTFAKAGTVENTITTGNLTFVYDEQVGQGNGITIANALPISDDTGKVLVGDSNVFNFQIIASTIGMPINYEVYAERQNNSTLPGSVAKIYLTTNTESVEIPSKKTVTDGGKVKTYNELTDTAIIGQTGKVIYQEFIKKDTVNYIKNFRLRMWLSDAATTVTDGNWDYNNQTFSVKVSVFAHNG